MGSRVNVEENVDCALVFSTGTASTVEFNSKIQAKKVHIVFINFLRIVPHTPFPYLLFAIFQFTSLPNQNTAKIYFSQTHSC